MPNDQVDESIETLRERLAKAEEEKKQLLERTTKAEGERDEARRTAGAAATQVRNSELDVINGAIEKAKTDRDILRAKYREARESGDLDAEANVNIEIADNAAKLRQLEAGKSIIEARRDNPPVPGADRPFTSLSYNEKVERIASGLTPQAAAWVRAHPDFVQTPQQVNALTGAHHIAVNKGLAQDTVDYFKDVETTLGITAAGTKDAGGGAGGSANGSGGGNGAVSSAGAPAREAPPAAAPAGGGGPRAGTVRLTPEQQEIAAASGLTHEEYAASLQSLKDEGKITTH